MHSTPTMNVTAFNERNVHDVRSKHDPKHQEVLNCVCTGIVLLQ